MRRSGVRIPLAAPLFVSMRPTRSIAGAHAVFDHADAFDRWIGFARRKHFRQAFAADLALYYLKSFMASSASTPPVMAISTKGDSLAISALGTMI